MKLVAGKKENAHRRAAAQLVNGQKRFELRLLSLPQRDQAKEVVDAVSAIYHINSFAQLGFTGFTMPGEEPDPARRPRW